jgi:hypothetical protein
MLTALIERTRLHQILTGARGGRQLDVGELARTVVAVSELMAERPKIVEMDLNRMFVQRDGVLLADRRILTE